MSTLTQVRSGLADRLRTISGVEVFELAPAVVSLPAMIVTPDEADVETMGRGVVTYRLSVTVLVSGADVTDQDLLDAYLHPSGVSSVIGAVAGDRTLGLGDVSASVAGWGGYGTHRVGDTDYLGAVFPVVVLTSGV